MTPNRKQGASWTPRAAAATVRKNSSEIAPRTLSRLAGKKQDNEL